MRTGVAGRELLQRLNRQLRYESLLDPWEPNWVGSCPSPALNRIALGAPESRHQVEVLGRTELLKLIKGYAVEPRAIEVVDAQLMLTVPESHHGPVWELPKPLSSVPLTAQWLEERPAPLYRRGRATLHLGVHAPKEQARIARILHALTMPAYQCVRLAAAHATAEQPLLALHRQEFSLSWMVRPHCHGVGNRPRYRLVRLLEVAFVARLLRRLPQ